MLDLVSAALDPQCWATLRNGELGASAVAQGMALADGGTDLADTKRDY